MADALQIPPLITLATDFGQCDSYAAAMKGVILSICPEARIEDLSHDIPPQDIHAAAFFTAGSAPYFPEKSIHVIVVDPGVGTSRDAIAVRAGGRIFICPDNGILTLYCRRFPVEAIRVIENPACMLTDISTTFHGRDIFAPAAAHLAGGVPLTDLGPEKESMISLDIPGLSFPNPGQINGAVVHIDHFGNCITNIHSGDLAEMKDPLVHGAGHDIGPVRRAYGEAESGQAIALCGSSGYLEVAVRNGSAALQLGLSRGAEVVVKSAAT